MKHSVMSFHDGFSVQKPKGHVPVTFLDARQPIYQDFYAAMGEMGRGSDFLLVISLILEQFIQVG